jgi:Protein of unknown function (DUF2442)
MSSLSIKTQEVTALRATVTEDSLGVDLSDGRTVSVPLMWYPRLLQGSPRERNDWRLIAGREGIRWPDLDEDLSVESVILGRASGESQTSLKRWLESREGATRRHRVRKTKPPCQTPRTLRQAARDTW